MFDNKIMQLNYVKDHVFTANSLSDFKWLPRQVVQLALKKPA